MYMVIGFRTITINANCYAFGVAITLFHPHYAATLTPRNAMIFQDFEEIQVCGPYFDRLCISYSLTQFTYRLMDVSYALTEKLALSKILSFTLPMFTLPA